MNIIDFLNSRNIIWFPVNVCIGVRATKTIVIDRDMPPKFQYAMAQKNRHNLLSTIIERNFNLMDYMSLDDVKEAQSKIDSHDTIGFWVDSRFHVYDVDNSNHDIDLSSVCYHESINKKLPHIFVKGDIMHRQTKHDPREKAKYAVSDIGEHFQKRILFAKKDAIVQNPELFVLDS